MTVENTYDNRNMDKPSWHFLFTPEKLCFEEKYWKWAVTLPFVPGNSYSSINWRQRLLSWENACFLNSLSSRTCLKTLALLSPSILNYDVVNCWIPVLHRERHLQATWQQNCKPVLSCCLSIWECRDCWVHVWRANNKGKFYVIETEQKINYKLELGIAYKISLRGPGSVIFSFPPWL